MNGPERVVAHARSMIGVPWRHQGRKPWALDCLGLVELTLLAARWPRAIALPARYGREPWDDQLRKGLREHLDAPVADGGRAGDVPLFRWRRGDPTHVGIMADHPLGGRSIIHASNRHGKVVETTISGELEACLIEIYRPAWGDA